MINSDMDNIIDNAIKSIVKDIDEKMEYCVRNFATPPIKGKLTKGKLKWRGIKLIISNNGAQRWIEQRGMKISPIIEIGTLMN